MTFLLVIIYITFISLGLPDALLGSGWPSMYQELGVSIASAGIVSMIVSGGTILSSFISGKVIRKFGVAKTTAVSVAMTAIALLGFSFSGHFFLLCLWAIPLGLGAGAVDSALNNFVALHYEAKHMNWLHCFWGVGASISPLIMSFSLGKWQLWHRGYQIVGIIQVILVVILFATLPMWKKVAGKAEQDEAATEKYLSVKELLALPSAKQILLALFCYCAIEATVGLWGSSFLVTVRGIEAGVAASWIAIYYAGITIGRFFSGILAIKLSSQQLIQLGLTLITLGVVILFMPLPNIMLLVGLFFIGLGCAPIYPSILHETPNNFGAANSQSMMGIQMGCAYIGITFMPPLFGLIAAKTSYQTFPYFLGAVLLVMVLMIGSSQNKIDSATTKK